MEWVSDDFWIVINNRLVDGRIIIAQLKKPGCPEAGRHQFHENILAVARVARPNNSVRIQRVLHRVRIARVTVPDFVGNPPAFQIPDSVIFERQLDPALVLDAGQRQCFQAIGPKTGPFANPVNTI